MKRCAAAVVALMVGLVPAGCTGTDEPTDVDASSSGVPGGGASPSMTFEEAHRKVPINGTSVVPITWDLSGVPDRDEVLAARRALAFIYWEGQSTDWTGVIPIGRFVYTEAFYEKILAPFAMSSAVENPRIGPIWIKVLGVEKTGADRSTVTFCTDLGYWHGAEEKNFRVRSERGTVQSYVMQNVESGDGERHWLADRELDPDVDRRAKYGAQCTKWAQHNKP